MNEYTIIKERTTIADCLIAIDEKEMAKKALDFNTSQELIDDFLAIITKQATLIKRHDVLEQLHFAGLIYG